MKKILYICFASLLLGVVSCRKYVEIPAEMIRELKYTSDYQALLYNSTKMAPAYVNPVFAADDIQSDELTWHNSIAFSTNVVKGNAYSWAEKLVLPDTEDDDWAKLYEQIRICNIIVAGVMSSENGTDAAKRNALAEAQVHRAFAYFTLVNMYAKQYDAATAGADPGVPLLLEPSLFASLPRASVQAVYNQVIADLNNALPSLQNLPTFSSNPSRAAAFAMLSRTYLNMRNFTDASRFADSTLKLKSTVTDLNNYYPYTTGPSIPGRLENPENIFYKGASYSQPLPLSPSVLAVMGTTDLRYKLWTAPAAQLFTYTPTFNTRGYRRNSVYTNESINAGLDVPEIMLIKAECEARADHASNAITILNTLRKKRFAAADYADLQATTGTAALQAVINERRIELVARGFRWFDQRRLQKDAGFITTVSRVYKGETYTLAPGSNRYVFPIADKYISLNSEIIQNPR